jgi:hypothetical protein
VHNLFQVTRNEMLHSGTPNLSMTHVKVKIEDREM